METVPSTKKSDIGKLVVIVAALVVLLGVVIGTGINLLDNHTHKDCAGNTVSSKTTVASITGKDASQDVLNNPNVPDFVKGCGAGGAVAQVHDKLILKDAVCATGTSLDTTLASGQTVLVGCVPFDAPCAWGTYGEVGNELKLSTGGIFFNTNCALDYYKAVGGETPRQVDAARPDGPLQADPKPCVFDATVVKGTHQTLSPNASLRAGQLIAWC